MDNFVCQSSNLEDILAELRQETGMIRIEAMYRANGFVHCQFGLVWKEMIQSQENMSGLVSLRLVPADHLWDNNPLIRVYLILQNPFIGLQEGIYHGCDYCLSILNKI